MPIRMELSRILIRELTDLQIIELREVSDAPTSPDEPEKVRTFPIVIGLPEAQAIERRLKGISVKRPQTHDLLASVITSLGGTLQSITITDLAEHTFFATLDVKNRDGEMVHIDSRPSDAIALGIAHDVPIYVAEHVLDSATSEEA
jgi:hypothetical protein